MRYTSKVPTLTEQSKVHILNCKVSIQNLDKSSLTNHLIKAFRKRIRLWANRK